MFAAAVYLLCAVTSLGCAALLLRSYAQNRAPLLMWSSLCFVGLLANNVLLFVDLVIVPGIDLGAARSLLATLGTGVLLFGLIRESA